MGEHQVHDTSDDGRTRTFVRAMLDDIRALEIMIEAYGQLDLQDLVVDTQRVLALNEQQGSFIPDPRELHEKNLSQRLWDYFGLDEN